MFAARSSEDVCLPGQVPFLAHRPDELQTTQACRRGGVSIGEVLTRVVSWP